MELVVIEKNALFTVKTAGWGFIHTDWKLLKRNLELLKRKNEWMPGGLLGFEYLQTNLQSYREYGIIPCSFIGGKYMYKESDLVRVLTQKAR